MGYTPEAWRWFMAQLVALEPGTVNSGTYTFKPGYHASRADNQQNWPANYSIRHAFDQIGPAAACAAGDWTFRAAQDGDYSRFGGVYGKRMRVAFDARDPRLAGWVEYLGQTDTDAPPEGLIFHNWTTRMPDDSHRWHGHFSEKRAYAESLDNKRAMLSIVRGETLTHYLARGGVLLAPDGSGEIVTISDRDFQILIWRMEALQAGHAAVAGGPTKGEPFEANIQLDRIETKLDEVLAAVKALAESGGGGGAPVEPALVLPDTITITGGEVAWSRTEVV